MGRAPCCSKVGLHRGPWTPKEDALLIEYISANGEGQWRSLPKKAGLLRCGKSCRLRWMNYLRPDIKRGNITPDEDDLIIRLHALLGNRWSLISGRLPGRTDNEIKNYWNTHLSKKLRSQGTDPETHKKLSDSTADDVNNPSRGKSRTRKSKTSGSGPSRNHKSNGSSKTKKKKRGIAATAGAAAVVVVPTASKIVVSRVTAAAAAAGEMSRSGNGNGNGEKVTKIHQPKPVRVTMPLVSSSLTRNSSNASFESNLTTISCGSNNNNNNVLIGGYVRLGPLMQSSSSSWQPPHPSDYGFINIGSSDEGSGVRFLIGCDDVDQEGEVGNAVSYAGDVAMNMGDEHGGKFEKLYDEYLQLIEVGGGGSDVFNDEVENDSRFVDDFLAESLLM